MNRKNFLKTCGLACLSGSVLSVFLESCADIKTVSGTISGSDLLIPVSDFEHRKEGQVTYKNHLIVQNPQLQYPIYISRGINNTYKAVLMRCTHQGTELQAFGEKLQCPAHGSEFGQDGQVHNGPAEAALRIFTVTADNQQISISLK